MSVDTDRLLADYKKVFGSEEGKRVLQDLARFCNVGVAMPAGADPVTVKDVEGMRRVFWHVYHHVYMEKPPSVRAKTAPTVDLDTFQMETRIPQ